MVALDGVIYRAQGDGKVSRAAQDAGAPFAVVTRFPPSTDGLAGPIASLADLERLCDGQRRSDNLFYAFRLDGVFEHVRTRAVSPPPEGGRLLDAAKTQHEFDFRNVTGTLVGIYSPGFSSAFSIPGYHYHFLSDDRTQGGHVLDIAALFRCLARLLVRRHTINRDLTTESRALAAENLWRAKRHGTEARLVDEQANAEVMLAAHLDRLLD